MIFSLAWNFMFTVNWKVLVLKFLRIKNVLFFRPESWWKDDIYWSLKSSCFELFDDGKYSFFWVKKLIEKMIYTDYWETLVLNFSVVWNTVFFWVEKLIEIWYLLINEKFLFWTSQWWEIRSFLQPKTRLKDDTYLGFLCFPWYSGTWEIRFFM